MRMSNYSIKKSSIEDFCVLLLIISLFSLKSIPGVMYIGQILFLVIIAIKINKEGISFNYYTIFNIMFLIWSIISIFWSPKQSSTIKALKPLLQLTVLCICLLQYYRNNCLEKIEKTLYYFCISSVILFIVIFLKTPISSWLEIIKETTNASTSAGRLGPTVGFQPNALGIILSFSSIIWLYLFLKYKNKFSAFMYLILCILIIFTKSRKALIVLLIGSLMYFILYKGGKKRMIMMTIGAICGLAITYWSILNIPFLYNMIGFRMEGIFSIFDSAYVADASVTTRSDMINIGINLFAEKPIHGVGLGNFSYYYYYLLGGWAETYSHNNYVEILSGLGLIGFYLYYFILFKMLYIMIIRRKQFFSYNRELFSLILILLSLRLFIDYGMVVYDDEFIQLLTVILYSGICYLNFGSKIKNKEIIN